MRFTKRNIKTNPPMQIGFIFLIIAGLARLALNRVTGLGPDMSDGIIGACYGIAIASLLLGIHRARRTQ